MARPVKTGLDYFSFDVDFFDNQKVRRIMRACGPAAGTILSCLLCNIYKWKGYYILWDSDMPFEIADQVGVSEGAVNEVVNKAVQVGFFNKSQFDGNGILTSHEVQKRYLSGTQKRSDVKIDPTFEVSEPETVVYSARNPVSSVDNTQSKVKEIKVKERRSLVIASDDETKALRKEYDQLIKSAEGKTKQEMWSLVKDFIKNKSPKFFEPYLDCWNLFALNWRIIKEPQKITGKRLRKFDVRIKEPGFEFLKILEIIRGSSFLKGENGSWRVDIDFILESESNYTKILENKYS